MMIQNVGVFVKEGNIPWEKQMWQSWYNIFKETLLKYYYLIGTTATAFFSISQVCKQPIDINLFFLMKSCMTNEAIGSFQVRKYMHPYKASFGQINEGIKRKE